MFEWDTFVCWFGGCYHGGYTTRPGWASPRPPPPNAGLPASRGPSTFRMVRVCWCLSLPFSILFLFSLAFPLVITLELFRLIHSSTVRHLSNAHWLDSRGTHTICLNMAFWRVSIVPVYNQASIFTTLVCNKWVNHLFCGNSKTQWSVIPVMQ